MAVVGATTVEIPTRLLVFGMARPDGSISASEVYEVAEACGQSAEQVRSCLRRLVAEGLLDRAGTGRAASYRTTPAGNALRLGPLRKHQLAYRQDRQGQRWDGRWHLAAFAVPEDRRAARDRLRDRLLEIGGAVITNGLYVSAHPWTAHVRGVAGDLGVAGCLSQASTVDLDVGGVTTPRELARSLWPIDELAAEYRTFVRDHQPVLDRLERLREQRGRIDDAAFVPGTLTMVLAFDRVFRRDPILPPELLPRPWPGRSARELLVSSRRTALRLRTEHERPALFSAFDELVPQGGRP